MRRQWSLAITLVGLLVLSGPSNAQDAADLSLDGDAASFTSSESPAAPLPVQPEGRGQYLPLHTASVMSWLCGDTTVQMALNKSRVKCYREFYPSVNACASKLQERAPSVQNRPTGTNLDILSFRAALRSCLQQHYSERLTARGLQAPAFLIGVPDPVAAQGRGIVRAR